MHLQNTDVKFASNEIPQFDARMIKTKEQDIKMAPSKKWNFCASILLQNLLSAHDRLPLRHISNMIVMGIVNNKLITQFHIGYMSFPALKQNKAFKYQVENNYHNICKKSASN